MEKHEIKTGRKNPFKRMNELTNGLVSASSHKEAYKALAWDCKNILRSAVVIQSPNNTEVEK